VSVFQCVANNHCCDGTKAECGKQVHGPDSVRDNRKSHKGFRERVFNGLVGVISRLSAQNLVAGDLCESACFQQLRCAMKIWFGKNCSRISTAIERC
jgi:hypothetical protein